MIYSPEVSTFAFTTKLNALTWTFGSASFLKWRYLRATLFGLTKWPSLWSKIGIVIAINYQCPFLECMTSTLLHLLTAIEFISGWFAILFPWVAVIGLVNTIWSMPTTLVVATGSTKLWLRFLPTKTPPNLIPNFVANPITTPLLTISILGATTISIPVVVILTLSDWITLTPTCCFRVSTNVTSNTIW